MLLETVIVVARIPHIVGITFTWISHGSAMRYLFLLLPLVAAACSETNGPDDVVTEVEICRDCGDGRTVVPVYENGRAPLPGTSPIKDGECEEWDLSELGEEVTGSDTLFLPWKFADTANPGVRVVPVPLSQKKVTIPCL